LFHVADTEIGAGTVIIVAHNPGIGALAYDLCVRATLAPADIALTLSRGFPTSAAAAFEFAPDRLACLGLFLPPHADCEGA
jgi:phosphohistidine phosphatase SixA